MPDALQNSKKASVTGAELERGRVIGKLWLIFGVGNLLEGFYSITLAAQLRVNRKTSNEAVAGTRVVIAKVVRSGWIWNTYCR